MNTPADGTTPLTPEEQEALIPAFVTDKNQLNEIEQQNILAAQLWLRSRRKTPPTATPKFLQELHRRMFGQTWKWAGKYRDSDKNIGEPFYRVAPAVRELCDNATFWRNDGYYSPEQIAVKFHHRLVQIHPFANGNGRHSRLAADLLAIELGTAPFTWGGTNLTAPGEMSARYINALRLMDKNPDALDELLRFARGNL